MDRIHIKSSSKPGNPVITFANVVLHAKITSEPEISVESCGAWILNLVFVLSAVMLVKGHNPAASPHRWKPPLRPRKTDKCLPVCLIKTSQQHAKTIGIFLRL